MTEALIHYVHECARAIGLSEWEIEVVRDGLPEHVFARCDVPLARQAAKITFGPQFFESSPEEKRATILHELLHCHFAQITEVVDESLPALLGRPAYNVFDNAHNLALEGCLDAIAVSVARLLPLPPEVE